MWPKKRKSSKGASSSNPQPEQPNTSQPTSLPPLQFIEPTHGKYYDELLKRKLYPTKHYFQETTRMLGIDEDIWFLFDNLRMKEFVAAPFLTYVEPTLEFFASFESTPVGNHDYNISFQLFNTKHTINLKTLNQHLGFSHTGKLFHPENEDFPDFSINGWWNYITNAGEYRFNYSTASQIIHLALRLLHRILGYSIFNKRDLGKLSSDELIVLYLATLPAHGKRLNLGHYFVKTCKSIKLGKKTSYIHCGAMVTRLAIKLGYERELSFCKVVGDASHSLLNIKALTSMSFIAGTPRTGLFHLLVSRQPYCFLPDRDRTSITRGGCRNVWFIRRDRNMENVGMEVDRVRDGSDEGDEDDDDDGDDEEEEVGGGFARAAEVEEEEPRLVRAQDREVANLSSQMQGTHIGSRASNENQDGMFLQIQALYDASVNRGIVTPPVNYPYWPPQHGPLPSWNGDNVPTYPYWQGPQGPTTPYPDDMGNYDYRAPGGCDYRGDPNYPYVDPTHPAPLYSSDTPRLQPWQEDNFAGHYGWPPGFTGGWEPHGSPPSRSDWRERSDLHGWNPPGPFDGASGSSGP